MTDQEATLQEPACPNCGESPMFRSQVHECCVELQRLQEVDLRGTCCQCDNSLSAGGHANCQKAARRALENMVGLLREIRDYTPAGQDSCYRPLIDKAVGDA